MAVLGVLWQEAVHFFALAASGDWVQKGSFSYTV